MVTHWLVAGRLFEIPRLPRGDGHHTGPISAADAQVDIDQLELNYPLQSDANFLLPRPAS